MLGVLAPASGQLLEISTTDLQVTSSFFIAPSIDIIEASSLGTEWLLAQGATPHQLSRLDPASGVFTTIESLSVGPSVSNLVTLRSQSVPLCLAIIPSTTLVPLVTDPVTTIPSVPVTLPWVGALSIFVFNE